MKTILSQTTTVQSSRIAGCRGRTEKEKSPILLEPLINISRALHSHIHINYFNVLKKNKNIYCVVKQFFFFKPPSISTDETSANTPLAGIINIYIYNITVTKWSHARRTCVVLLFVRHTYFVFYFTYNVIFFFFFDFVRHHEPSPIVIYIIVKILKRCVMERIPVLDVIENCMKFSIH